MRIEVEVVMPLRDLEMDFEKSRKIRSTLDKDSKPTQKQTVEITERLGTSAPDF